MSQAVFALAVAALAAAGGRLACAMEARGLERVVAATVFTAATAVAEALLLGLVGLGGSPVALVLGSLAAWGLVRIFAHPGGPTARVELVEWSQRAGPVAVAGAGAAAGALLAFTVWSLHEPALGYDAVLYHLPEAVGWVHGGRPGSVQEVVNALPVGNYPVALEQLLAWGMGLSRSLVPVTLIGCAAMGLTGLATWTGLRRMSVPRHAAAAGAAALVAVPAVLTALSNGWSTDPAALAWVTACGALCAGAATKPGLLVPAVVAGGLAVGTKTTALPLALLLVGATLVAQRRALGKVAEPLVAAGVLALVVGGLSYLRNLLDHGSPLWPFLTTPFGDPPPPVIALADASFLERPLATLDNLSGYYLETFGAGILLIGAAVLAPLLRPSRVVVVGAAATAASALLWASAPGTGTTLLPGLDIGTGDATRYLLPALAAAVLTLGLAARAGGWRGAVAVGVLALAAAIGLAQAPGVGAARLPPPLALFGGAVIGAAGGLAVARRCAGHRTWARRVSAVGAVAVFALCCAAAASGFVERHVATKPHFEGPAIERLVADASFRQGSEPVASTFSEIGVLTGDRLQHRLDLIRPGESCPRLRHRRERGWLVIPVSRTPRRDLAAINRCLGRSTSFLREPDYVVWGPAPERRTRGRPG